MSGAAATVRITRVGADGDGVATLPGGEPLYVAGTLPGELVRAVPEAKRGEGWAAHAESLLEPSPDRIRPACRHFGACGGCALQHWGAAPYQVWKRGLLEAALRRAGFPVEVAPLVATPPGARRRIDLAFHRRGRDVVLGLHAPRAGTVVDLEECPVLDPTLARLLGPLKAVLPGKGSAVLNLLDAGPDLLLVSDTAPGAADRTRLADFARRHGLCRIAWRRGTNPAETLCELRPPTTLFSGVAVRPPPGAFLQASREGEAAIVAAVLAGLPDRWPARAPLVELYAGCGTLSFALAQRARVAAYEGDAEAASALRSAANTQGLAGRVSVEQRDLARRPLGSGELKNAAAVVLDPPWSGAARQMTHLAAARPARIIYVSCNPAALARDAAALHAAGYAATAATPIDQFVWSSHLESVVTFVSK